MGMKGNGVHIAFHHNDLTCSPYFRERLIKREQKLPFIEYRRFRRIQILRFAVIHHPAAKGYRFAFKVENREHAPVPERVIISSVLISYQTGCNQNGIGYMFYSPEISVKLMPRIRSKSKLEPVYGFIGQMPALKIGQTRFPHIGSAETIMEIYYSQFHSMV